MALKNINDNTDRQAGIGTGIYTGPSGKIATGNNTQSLKPYDFSKVTDPTGDFFQGTWNFHNDQIKQYDPFIGGYAFIYWTRLPEWLMNIETGTRAENDINMYNAFKWMTMRNFKSFDGLSDIELGAEAMTAGFTGNELNTVTNITKGNTEFTLKHQELSGSPIRKIYSSWVNGLRDMDTGIATYGGNYNIEGGYNMKNNTGELIYIVTDPSGGTMKNSIEFAAYFTNVFPTRVPYSHLNYTSGEHGLAEIDIPFKGVFHQSTHVNELAEAMLPYIVAYRTADQFIPSIVENEYALKNQPTVI